MRIDGSHTDAPVKALGADIGDTWSQYTGFERTPLTGQYPASTTVKPLRSINGDGPGPVQRGALAVKRTILPVLGLFAAMLAAWQYSDMSFALLDGEFAQMRPLISTWLSWGDALIAVSYFVIHMTSRRYGIGYAIAQIIVTWTLIVAALFMAQARPDLLSFDMQSVAPRVALTTAIALCLSQMVAAVVFDGMRGVRWWPAPLFGSFWSAWVFVILRYPSAYFASGIDWTSHMAVHFGVLGGVGILLLLPYCLFRPLVQPLSGYNGY